MSWEVQDAYNYRHVELPHGEWFSLSQKVNGIRGTIYDGKVISKQGRELSGFAHILIDLRILFPELEEYVLDGELIRKNPEKLSDNANFRLTAGIVNSKDADKSAIMYVIFDVLPKEEFEKGESALTYRDRLAALRRLGGWIKQKRSYSDRECDGIFMHSICIVPAYYEGTDQSQIEVWLEKMDELGKEGLILNRDTPYYRKRHKGVLKVKSFHTADLEIIGFEEGKGRLEGKLGAFIVRYCPIPWDNANEVRVGTGLTDDQRLIFWQNREQLLGRIIEVMYKEESEDKYTGLKSLQFPVFITLREEGKEESYE